MRLLLLLLLAAITSAAAPFVAFAVRPDLVPAGGEVVQGWQDAVEIGRLLFERWQRGESGTDGAGPPGFDEPRLRTALAVAAAAALWLAAFLAGGLVSLALLGIRFRNLVVAALLLLVLPVSCVAVGFQIEAAPGEERIIRAVLSLVAAALVSGFAVVQGFRQITV